jgi:UDP-N-acetylmuramoylalanine--D-glutamate ligase
MKLDLGMLAGKDIVFVGIGKGRSMAGIEAFLREHADIKSFAGVHRDRTAADPLAFLTRDYDAENTAFFKNEAIPAAAMPVPYWTPMQLFLEVAHSHGLQTIGITGTKGKSTTASLTASILNHAGKHAVLAGNIGVSPWAALSAATPETIFVLELSSYQLADLTISPHISACINLYNDHMDWHGSIDAYWEAKHNIMRFAGTDDVFIYNPDFRALQLWADDAACKTIAIDPTRPVDLTGAHLYGEHNAVNALIAREITRQLGVTDEQAQAAIRAFEPLRHRMQTVAVKNGKTYIDDAIGMTPESTMASLSAVTTTIGPVGCLLLGGQDRGYDFALLMQAIASYNIPSLVLFPETEAKMKAALPQTYTPDIYQTSSMQEAVAYAAEHAPDGSVILLSTAAPSYLLWRDFEEKGDQFQATVRSLAG